MARFERSFEMWLLLQYVPVKVYEKELSDWLVPVRVFSSAISEVLLSQLPE